ncbi:hypothetical protein [Collimonas fungivorans]|uniref:hypothetical protein n=1 Tax=Collimonas fungivorans TaxID=158899 RepID=UPI003FA35264
MSVEENMQLALIGCGSIFDAMQAAWTRLGNKRGLDVAEYDLLTMPLTLTDTISADVTAYLAGMGPTKVRVYRSVVRVPCAYIWQHRPLGRIKSKK